MSHRLLTPIRVLTLLVMALLLASLPAMGQQKAAATANKANAAGSWTISRTPWGDPDLQGIYSYATRTPLERSAAAGHKASYTEAELAELEDNAQAKVDAVETDTKTLDKPRIDYNYSIWFGNDEGRLTGRTSLIVEPEDGRIPALTERGQKLHDDLVAEAKARRVGGETIYNSWADHPTFTRCISRPLPRGAFYQLYNYGINIIQNPGYVAIHYESMHDVRIIPLDGRPHVDSRIQLWNGDSRGHWEGNTLVIDFTNFTDKQEFVGLPQGSMHVTERLTKVDANTINYQVTIDDPTIWTKPWTWEAPWRADDPGYQHPEDLYEYACHEGNFRMMEDTLKGSIVLKQGQSGK
jgi:hypothetical protein